jgi:hypothetical protein
MDEGIDKALDNWLCLEYNDGVAAFPCSTSPIQAVSLGLAAGGVGLLMALWLTKKVCLKTYRSGEYKLLVWF